MAPACCNAVKERDVWNAGPATACFGLLGLCTIGFGCPAVGKAQADTDSGTLFSFLEFALLNTPNSDAIPPELLAGLAGVVELRYAPPSFNFSTDFDLPSKPPSLGRVEPEPFDPLPSVFSVLRDPKLLTLGKFAKAMERCFGPAIEKPWVDLSG
jgi:hypothetical protein